MRGKTDGVAIVADGFATRLTGLLTGPGQATLRQALRAGIAAQSAVLDGAGSTGSGRSSAGVRGLPGGVLAGAQAGHLGQEVALRGCGGGPLAAPAGHLNQDVTQLQGQRVEGALPYWRIRWRR